jgi:hypothetical protein
MRIYTTGRCLDTWGRISLASRVATTFTFAPVFMIARRLIGTLGHELVHVRQYRNGMNWLTYLWSTRNGYINSPYEKAVYALGNKIENDLINNPGGSCGCRQ